MNADKISVIIPIKNRADLIGFTIDSILNQSLKAHEIILVDDGSTDNIEEALIPYTDKIIFIKNKGVGPGSARNTGLEKATGAFIKFFDSDDLMSSNTLQVQVNKLNETNKNYVTSPYIYAQQVAGNWISESGDILNYHNSIAGKPLYEYMIWGLFIPIPSMLFRKAFLEQIGPWPTDIVTSEDWIYLWRIAMQEPFPEHVNACAFIYRLHTYQSTGANMDNLGRDKEKFRILQRIYAAYLHGSGFTPVSRLLFKLKFYQMASVTTDASFKSDLLKAAGRGQWLVWIYYRLKMKMGRWITKSNWQPMHGVSKNKDVIASFLKM